MKKLGFLKISLIFALFALFASPAFSQNMYKLGNKAFKQGKYCEAIKFYDQYLRSYRSKDAFLKRGISHYHCNHLDKAIDDLESSLYLGNVANENYLYLAKAYHDKLQFDKAIPYYKKYLSFIYKNKAERKLITEKIKRCAQGIDLQYKNTDHFIENWGKEINTAEDDIIPLQSYTKSNRFYFASNRDYNGNTGLYKEFQVEYNNGKWEKLLNIIGDESGKNIIFLDFFDNYTKVLYFTGFGLDKGILRVADYENIFKDLKKSYVFDGPVNPATGFRYVYFINDSTIIFSSNRPGGYGGYDLYISGIRDGHWFKPVNLGPVINSAYDEISPYMTPDGRTLYFSSNSTGSIGGFDIFKSTFDEYADDWEKPQNLGLPANSAANEIGFRLLSSGKAGIYNSNRKDFGFGKHDIYWIYFKNQTDLTKYYIAELPYLRNKHLTPLQKVVVEPEVVVETTPEPPQNKVDTTAVAVVDVQKKEPLPPPVKEPEHKSKKEPEHKSPPAQKKKPPVPVKKDKESKKETFVIPQILVKDNKFRDNNTVVEFINNLAKLMIKYPQLKVEIVGNSFSWDKPESALPNSIRLAGKLADSLILRMISPERIIIKGNGANFPAAKPNGPVRSKNIISKINNRVDIYLHIPDSISVKPKYESLYISKAIRDPRHKLYETIMDGLTYKVQFKEGDFVFLDDLLNKYPDSSIEKDPVKSKYYYTVGLYKDYASAKQLYDQLVKEGRQELVIVPYIDGIRIDKDQAIKYAKKYIDLVNYLEDNKN